MQLHVTLYPRTLTFFYAGKKPKGSIGQIIAQPLMIQRHRGRRPVPDMVFTKGPRGETEKTENGRRRVGGRL